MIAIERDVLDSALRIGGEESAMIPGPAKGCISSTDPWVAKATESVKGTASPR